ncbi:hypothetical protein [Oceanobacillus sojae]|uniref:hypothetical protein n=1 Tax=Oceanobacillus sojae TaxID=582851 RepID=UPI00363CD71C
MTLFAVVFGTFTVLLIILLLAALSDLREWKRRWNKSNDEKYELLEDYLKGCGELRRLESKLKVQESKLINPADTDTYVAIFDTEFGPDRITLKNVYEIKRVDGENVFEDKEGNVLAIIPSIYRYIIKEENE